MTTAQQKAPIDSLRRFYGRELHCAMEYGSDEVQNFWPTSLKHVLELEALAPTITGESNPRIVPEVLEQVRAQFESAAFAGVGMATDKAEFVPELSDYPEDTYIPESINGGEYDAGELVGILRLDNGLYLTGNAAELERLNNVFINATVTEAISRLKTDAPQAQARWEKAQKTGRKVYKTPIDVIREHRQLNM